MSNIVALAGGVGGSKLAYGLYDALQERLTVIVNTGDDETMFGLRVCPDLDTMRYTLSGLANTVTGWGLANDSFNALDEVGRYGLETWFRLGDRDLGSNLARTQLLLDGWRLTDVEARLDAGLALKCRLLPMCDEPVATRITVQDGELAFQEYFVKRQHRDQVERISYRCIEQATLSPEIQQALETAGFVILCPSNPMVSIAPILAVPGLRPLLDGLNVPRVAVSPIIGGQAVSGPAGQMMAAAGCEVSVVGLAHLYKSFLTGIVIDEADGGLASALRDLGLDVLATNTIMKTPDHKRRLATEILEWLGAA